MVDGNDRRKNRIQSFSITSYISTPLGARPDGKKPKLNGTTGNQDGGHVIWGSLVPTGSSHSRAWSSQTWQLDEGKMCRKNSWVGKNIISCKIFPFNILNPLKFRPICQILGLCHDVPQGSRLKRDGCWKLIDFSRLAGKATCHAAMGPMFPRLCLSLIASVSAAIWHWAEKQGLGLRDWTDVEVSPDGSVISAVATYGALVVSFDGGETWYYGDSSADYKAETWIRWRLAFTCLLILSQLYPAFWRISGIFSRDFCTFFGRTAVGLAVLKVRITPDGSKIFTVAPYTDGVWIWTHRFTIGNSVFWTLVFGPN